MTEISDLVKEGEKFVFSALHLFEAQRELIGRMSRLEKDQRVLYVRYNCQIYSMDLVFKQELSFQEFEKTLDQYGIPKIYFSFPGFEAARTKKIASIHPWGLNNFSVHFSPVDVESDYKKWKNQIGKE